MLALFAQNRPARRRLDPLAYAALRNELIAACRSFAETDDPNRPFYAGLEETVKPWLDLRVLEHTDREILSSVLQHCRAAERELDGGESRRAWVRRVGLALAIVGIGAVTGGLVWLLLPAADRAMLNSVREAADTIWLTFWHADDWQKWSAVAVIVVLASMFIASRTARA